MRAVVVAVIASLALTATGLAQSKQAGVDQAALTEFETRVAAYLALAKQLESRLPTLKRTDDAAEIQSREVAYGVAIRTARSGSRAGDVISPAAAKAFQRIIKHDFRQRSASRKKLVTDEIPHFHPRVNMTYPTDAALATFPVTLLGVLPALPQGLEYRLLSEALILRDVKANIIVDFIRDVF